MRRRHQLPPRSKARWQSAVQRVRRGEVLRDRVIAVIGRSGDRKPLLAANTRECTRIKPAVIKNQLSDCLLIFFAYSRFTIAFLQLLLGAGLQLQRRLLRADGRLDAEREPKTQWNSARRPQPTLLRLLYAGGDG